MRKKKIFHDNTVLHNSNNKSTVDNYPRLWSENPVSKNISFKYNSYQSQNFSFSQFYSQKIDSVTRLFHQVILIKLKQASINNTESTSINTIVSYCISVKIFLIFCIQIQRSIGRELRTLDINEKLLRDFVGYLKTIDKVDTTKSINFSHIKTLLILFIEYRWIDNFDINLIPQSPFPRFAKKTKGAKPLTESEHKKIASVLNSDIRNLFKSRVNEDGQKIIKKLNKDELIICTLSIAIRTGINTTPLLNLTTDCITENPLNNNKKIITWYKRRGKKNIDQTISTKSIRTIKGINIHTASIIELIIEQNKSIRESNKELANKLLVYQSTNTHKYKELPLLERSLHAGIKKWIEKNNINNILNNPIEINISTLRKTFINNIFVQSGGNPIITAQIAGNSVRIANDHYLQPSEDSLKNMALLGKIFTNELLDPNTANNTPVSKCSNKSIEYCTNFHNCVRCSHFIVTKDDLYRLFSYYWMIIRERKHIGKKLWSKNFKHAIKIIDNNIAPEFDPEIVIYNKEKAKKDPHIYWKDGLQIN